MLAFVALRFLPDDPSTMAFKYNADPAFELAAIASTFKLFWDMSKADDFIKDHYSNEVEKIKIAKTMR